MSIDQVGLLNTLEKFASLSKTQPLTLGEAIATLDQTAYALISLILVLPFLQPIPMGPISVIGGFTFTALGWQMWQGLLTPALPEKICHVVLGEKIWGLLVNVCLKLVKFCHKFTRPRFSAWISDQSGQKIGAFILMVSGLLMMIPFGVLPFNNSLPGLAILFYCIGELEEDGLMVIIAFIWLIVTIIYFSFFFFGLYYLGGEAVNYFKLK